MRLIAKYFRLIHINIVLLKHGLDRIVWASPMLRPLSIFIIFFPWRWFKKQEAPPGEAIRKALEELGPIFVKFGQLLSIRRDLLPDDIAEELTKLQDRVPPFPGEIAIKIIENSLQQPLSALFAEFDSIPLASASISQVHSAILHDGRRVVAKVLRPKIAQIIQRDVELLETFAKIVFRTMPKARRFRPIEVVEEFKNTLFDELDLLREAANASQLRRNFANSESLYVPEVYWEYSRNNVLVMEQIYGTHILDIKSLVAKNTNLKLLAERGVEIFFTQVFRDCFFHADMHPGNLFVATENPDNPRYIAVDFGIMGTLSPEDQRYLGENFLAFFKRDYRRVAELHVQSGWVPPHTRIEAFESAIRTVCEPIFERPLKDISIGQTLLRLFQTARRFDMEIQPQLVLLQKTLLTIEGVGRQLYPELDLWKTAKPYLEKWMKKQFGPAALFHTLKNKLPLWTDRLPDIPEAIYDIARFWQNETHYMQHQQSAKRLSHQEFLKKTRKHLTRKIFGATILILVALFAFNTTSFEPLLQAMRAYQFWILGGGAIVGLFCIFKN
ncbi:MAG: ubiquinone biosynthesis regulatory protein kinase UbiB [Candidatus Berkiellales bacterium]